MNKNPLRYILCFVFVLPVALICWYFSKEEKEDEINKLGY